MKKRKLSIVAIITNLILALVVGLLMSPVTGFNPLIVTAVIFLGGTGLQFFVPSFFAGIAMEGVYREIWTGQLVESFQPELDASFLNEIPDESRHVQSSVGGENQVIHLVDIGADPEVLINNTTYPIGYSTLTDGDIAFQLDVYDTVATKILATELYAITYDKIEVANKKHKNAILAKKFGKAIHALAPSGHTNDTPVLGTTGATISGKKVCSVDDIIALAGALSDAGVPDDGQRILVLNSKHVTSLLKEVKNFYQDYANVGTGQLKSLLYGFKVYVYHNMPFYLASNNTKVSFGAVFNPATHNVASVAFYAPDMFKAEGATQMYYDEPNTQTRFTALNYNHRYLVSPKKARAIGALVTTTV
ncbi:hypothetical protein LNQ49_12785 [Flavobacterium sp. F-65]|uniref:Major capsid protein n=1 Tax=Flavobacterium pisciphilum TaxID=2893755 RepID=A0ABS8MUL3_9FLAO|nr:hypothetical protein [Flavobacterium sp. F-65]MCC9072459.1 hypothetical protein [Flavobacterium sp. F-65]